MKTRLDKYLLQAGLAASRQRAQALIHAGAVTVNGTVADKPALPVDEGDSVALCGQDIPYVSRGGLKLERAIDCFALRLTGLVCADIGASTGGFTDCMLQNGAQRVYAIDVGSDQLDPRLRADKRVICMEQTNIRDLAPDQLPETVDFFGADVSFISLKHVLPAAAALTGANGAGVCLVKPQFEAGRAAVGKKGVVRDAAVHRAVLAQVLGYAVLAGFSPAGLAHSPIKGQQGNIEFLLYLTKTPRPPLTPQHLAEVVAAAHKAL